MEDNKRYHLIIWWGDLSISKEDIIDLMKRERLKKESKADTMKGKALMKQRCVAEPWARPANLWANWSKRAGERF